MDDPEDIFGEDVRDPSYLQIVSSDEEDLYLAKISDKPFDKNNFPSNTSSTKNNYYEERFDRHFRLDKTLESDVNLDTQNIINEINKIFKKSESENEPKNEENNENIFEKGKKIIKRIKSRLSSISDGFLTPKKDDLKIPKQKKRTRANTRIDYSHFFEYEDYLSSSSSSESILNDDEEFNPYLNIEMKQKKSKNNKNNESNKRIKIKNKYNRNNKSKIESILTNIEENKPYDKYGFDNSDSDNANYMLEKDGEYDNNSSDMLCLKFVVMDQNKNLINDKKLENVFIKNSETLGNIAKKVGEMYKIDEEDFEKIKIIIDGESQDHKLEIGNPILGVENNMQIDIKFPSKENNNKMDVRPTRVNKINKVNKPKNRRKPQYSRIRPSFYTQPPINQEFIEID